MIVSVWGGGRAGALLLSPLMTSGKHGHPAARNLKAGGSSPSQHVEATWSAHDLWWKCVRRGVDRRIIKRIARGGTFPTSDAFRIAVDKQQRPGRKQGETGKAQRGGKQRQKYST